MLFFCRSVTPEFEGKPVGHIHERLDYWTDELEAGPYVQKVLKEGFKLNFDRRQLPKQYQERNNKSALDHKEFVESEIEKLLERGCIVRTYKKTSLDKSLNCCREKRKVQNGN